MKYPKRISALILLCVGVFTAVCIWNLQFLSLDYNFENFFPENDEETVFFKEHRERFASDNDFLLVAVKNNDGVFRKDFLLELENLLADLDTVTHVDTVLSLTRMNKLFVNDFGKWKVPYINYDNLDSLQNDSIWISKTPDVYGSLISKDCKTLSIFVKHQDYLSKEGCAAISESVNNIKSLYDFDEMHIAGRSVGQIYYVALMQSELKFFMVTSLVLLLVFLILAFRSWWGILLPVTVVVASVIWILGIMAMLQKPLNLVLTVLPTIIFIVGMSDVIHIVSKYLEELRKGKPKFEALKITIKEVGMATLLTSVTTAVGFLTLYFSRVVPIKDFGVYVAMGVMITFVLSFLVLPSMFALIPTPSRSKKKSEATFWTKVLRRSFLWTIHNQVKVVSISGIILIGSFVGLSALEVNNFLLEDLKENDPLNKSFMFFDEHFSGARPMELSIECKEGSILTPSNLRELDSLERLLVSIYPNESFGSVLTVIKSLNRVLNGGSNLQYKLPEADKELRKITSRLKKQIPQELLKQYLTADEKYARFSSTVPDLGGNQYRALNNSFAEKREGQFPQFNIHHTGTAHLIDKNNQYLSTSMVLSLLIAFAVIAGIVGFLFRSLKMVLISLIPNVFPLVMIAGIMGVADIDIKVSTAILFTIAFGIAVDDTIHFISKLKLEINKGASLVFALRRTYMSTGRALVLTTAILSAGFLTLIFSNFLGTLYLGLLVSLTLFFALVADLFLLPILILWFYKIPKSNSKTKSVMET
tara:strand:+ start:51 stop:2330 length:2280 start_codon:yes stop_codon:yes gene_type:complete